MTDTENADPMVGASFFDRLAGSWDRICIHPPERVGFIISSLGIRQGDRVLDVGCGTGVLSPWLSEAVGPDGRVLAVDLSPRMIEVASGKASFANVEYHVADFLDLEAGDVGGSGSAGEPDVGGPGCSPTGGPARGGFDLIVVYSAFPHFMDRASFFRKARALLVPGGRLAIAHIESRGTINDFHDRSGPPSNPLPPVEELAAEADKHGFKALSLKDDGFYLYLGERS